MRRSALSYKVQSRPRELDDAEISNPRNQIPNKSQVSSSKKGGVRARSLGIWVLGFVWNLRFGIWTLRRYGVAAAVAAGEAAGAGEPKLKFTVGAFSAPGCAAKNGRGENP